MSEKNSISIAGCGWLGFPLSKSLIKKGYNVKGSSTSLNKLPLLDDAGIEPFLVQFPDNCSFETLSDFLKSEILIITVPPGRNSLKNDSYFGLLNTLTNILPNGFIKKIIFISSTSVYGDVNKTVNEKDEPCPDTDAGNRLLTAEQIIHKIPVNHTIVRLSGLIGPGRHPGRFLAGKKNVRNGLAPVNLIHLDDVISIILQLVAHESAGVYNATTPDHPTREVFYTLAAASLGLEPPQFIPEKVSWKEVTSCRVYQELNYRFQVADLMQWLVTQPDL